MPLNGPALTKATQNKQGATAQLVDNKQGRESSQEHADADHTGGQKRDSGPTEATASVSQPFYTFTRLF